MSSSDNYIDKKTGIQKFFIETCPLFLRYVLLFLCKQHNVNIKSNTYLVAKLFWMDKGMPVNFKSSTTIAKEIGCLSDRTARGEIKTLKKIGIISDAENLDGRKGVVLNTKLIIQTAIQQNVYYSYTDEYGKKRPIPEYIYTYERNKLKGCLSEHNITYKPSHLDLFSFLTNQYKKSSPCSIQDVANKIATISDRTIYTVLDEFEKAGIIRFTTDCKKDFVFTSFSSPETANKPADTCENSAKKCENSATESAKILPHKNNNILIYQEEHIDELIQISQQENKTKNISQCWKFLEDQGITAVQLQRYIYPVVKKQKDPDIYLNFKITQFEYLKKHHPFRIWKNNAAKLLYNTIINPDWNYTEYLLHLVRIKHTLPPKKTESVKQPDKRNADIPQIALSKPVRKWIDQLRKNDAGVDQRDKKMNIKLAKNIERFLKM